MMTDLVEQLIETIANNYEYKTRLRKALGLDDEVELNPTPKRDQEQNMELRHSATGQHSNADPEK